MVPDKFNMVDMEGIDIITNQGEEFPGLYQKLVESITQCRYQCLYNWKSDGVNIPPSFIELVVDPNNGNILINSGIYVTSGDVITTGVYADYSSALIALVGDPIEGVSLTDSIEALTTYANQTTGASDTNLSDAVYTLAQGYGEDSGFSVLQYCTRLNNVFQSSQLEDVDLDLRTFPYVMSFSNMFISSAVKTIKIRNFVSSLTNINCSGMFYYMGGRPDRIEFIDCNFSPQNCTEMFRACGVQVITGELDFTNTTNVGQMFTGANRLTEIRFKANTLKIDMGTGAHFSDCSLLSDDSLVSIANGLSPDVTGKTIELHATPKARCSTLMGTNDNGTFVASASGILSLAGFITTVKGWTLA